jgi:hypothetical protein
MPDITVTITDEEVLILESYYESVEQGVRNAARRYITKLVYAVINDSTSLYNPYKLSNNELRTLISELASAGEIPEYYERYPERSSSSSSVSSSSSSLSSSSSVSESSSSSSKSSSSMSLPEVIE